METDAWWELCLLGEKGLTAAVLEAARYGAETETEDILSRRQTRSRGADPEYQQTTASAPEGRG